VSSAMVQAADEVIAVGGGDIARDEAAAAIALGKPVRFVAADMNHALARQKARDRQEAEPTDFRGTVAELFSNG
jgi:shikimate kinase